jgi:uracil-DNA glycosylase family 4
MLKSKDIISFIQLYQDIGINLIFEDQKQGSDLKSFSQSKKINTTADKKLKVDIEIKELEKNFKNLEGFNLKKTAVNFIPFQGSYDSKILILDGMPNSVEDMAGQSFVGDKGILFKKMLNAIGLKIEDVFIGTCIPWRPPGNRYPTNIEIEICRPYIYDLIKILKPTTILCLGEIATNFTLKTNQAITKSRGKWHKLCLTTNNQKEIVSKVLPTLNISYLITRPDMKRQAWEDMKLLREQIKEDR